MNDIVIAAATRAAIPILAIFFIKIPPLFMKTRFLTPSILKKNFFYVQAQESQTCKYFNIEFPIAKLELLFKIT
jgi:hypothetical protein